jgi:MYXO-CTERM domain-containing protein
MHFVAMKLQADKSVSDIKPIGMTYDSDQPLIPLRLTSVAAQPEMGIVTFILADKRWAPQNYIDLKIPDSLIQFDQYGYQSNYLRLVSSESDKVGGQAFVTEYAKATTDLANQISNMFVNPSIQDAMAAKTELTGLLEKYPYITRLYARISAEEMTADPVFMVSSNAADVNNIHDLTDPGFDYSQCQGIVPPLPLPPEPCNFSYCGRQGACTAVGVALSGAPDQTMPTAACVCANAATARITTTGANGTPAIYCEPVSVNFDDSGTGAVAASNGCDGFDCGPHGACVSMNGNPTCQCEAGYAAIVGPSMTSATGATVTSIDCRKVTGTPPAMPVLPPVGQTTIPKSSSDGGAGGAPTTETPPPSSGGAGGGASTSEPSTGGATSAPAPSTNPAAPASHSSSDSGCNVGSGKTSSVASLLFAMAAAAAARRRRKTHS